MFHEEDTSLDKLSDNEFILVKKEIKKKSEITIKKFKIERGKYDEKDNEYVNFYSDE